MATLKKRTILTPAEVSCYGEDYPWVIERWLVPPDRLSHSYSLDDSEGWWAAVFFLEKDTSMGQLLQMLREEKDGLAISTPYAQDTGIRRLRNLVTEDIIMADIV